MQEFKSVDDILDFAIGNEQDAHDFYMDLADKMANPAMKEVFEQFAMEELGHKAKLLGVKAGGTLKPAEKQVLDLKISDYMSDVEPHEGMSYAHALNVAMQAEKRAFMLYSDLAKQATDAGVKELFQGLAQEEAKHKLRFELEYDENVLREN